MDFSGLNAFHELVEANEEAKGRFLEIKAEYEGKVHRRLIELLGEKGFTLSEEDFVVSMDPETRKNRNYRLQLAGLLLSRIPSLKKDAMDYSAQMDREFALAKLELARTYGIRIRDEEMETVTLWTGLL